VSGSDVTPGMSTTLSNRHYIVNRPCFGIRVWNQWINSLVTEVTAPAISLEDLLM
jgi:hypothetical protein